MREVEPSFLFFFRRFRKISKSNRTVSISVLFFQASHNKSSFTFRYFFIPLPEPHQISGFNGVVDKGFIQKEG